MLDLVTVILAAGKGTRMKSKLPKVLHKAAGKPMLQHVLDAAKGAGAKRNIVVVGFGGEMVKEAMGDQAEFVVQAEQLGTGHAVRQTEALLKDEQGTVVVLCGDTPLVTADLITKLYEGHKAAGAKATVLTAIMPDATGYGRIIRTADGDVARIVEQKDATEEERKINEVNSGIYCFECQDLFAALAQVGCDNAQGEYYLPDVLGILRDKGEKIWAVAADDYESTLGINSRLQLSGAEKILRRRKNIELMNNGVTLMDPDSTFVDADVEVGPDTIIYPFTWLESGVHIRPNSHIHNHVKIGNFVEVKNSQVGEGTKLPHLQYIGDADVGANVNLGCGTVTVNYDGKKKFRTTIGDNAFVGCNTSLVAPVEVGDGAYIGAGSVITKNVPSGTLAIGRARQKLIEGWTDKRE